MYRSYSFDSQTIPRVNFGEHRGFELADQRTQGDALLERGPVSKTHGGVGLEPATPNGFVPIAQAFDAIPFFVRRASHRRSPASS